jgi:ribosomal protein S18 acetylase RimI-like enzyme
MRLHCDIRHLQPLDTQRLLAFYSSLSEAVHGSFRPFDPIAEPTFHAHLEEAAQGRHVTLGLVDGEGTIWGHAFVLLLREPKPVFGIGLHQDIHGQGWGRRLMQATLDEADAQKIPLLTLTVLKDNTRARALYEKMGFSTKGDATFRLPNDCFYMERAHPNLERHV